MNLKEYVMHNLWMASVRLGLTRILSDASFAKLQYKAMTGKRLNLANPVDFNEKVQWLKLHYRNPLMTRCADKYEVRSFVEEKAGAKYLVSCIGVYDNVDEIPFEKLPDKFVLKATHGSGWNIICPDKSKILWRKAKQKMRKWLKSDYTQNGREWQYHDIKPRIICEEFIGDSDGSALKDYKLLTFKGETRYIWVDYVERDGKGTEISKMETGYSKPKLSSGQIRCRNIYDPQWNLVPNACILPGSEDPLAVNKPECLDEMIGVARKLASDFPQCRVDLYVLDGKRIVFGELTFTSDNGCSNNYTQRFNAELGSYIELPKATV